jgi:hypothetical protein
MLALVVGGAAAIPARAFDGERPRRQAAPPLIVEAADGVAMTVDQHRDQGGIFDAFRHQERRPLRVVEHARGEAERGEARDHLVVEIRAQYAGAFRLLAGARDGDAPLKVDEEFAAVEMGVGASDRGGAAHAARPIRGCVLESIGVADYGQGYCMRAIAAARMLSA